MPSKPVKEASSFEIWARYTSTGFTAVNEACTFAVLLVVANDPDASAEASLLAAGYVGTLSLVSSCRLFSSSILAVLNARTNLVQLLNGEVWGCSLRQMTPSLCDFFGYLEVLNKASLELKT